MRKAVRVGGCTLQGMRDVRASPPPVPEDARRRAINRAHAETQKKRKDAKAAKRTKKILAREELDKCRRQQRKDGLPLEESPLPSISTDALDGDDEDEMGRGPLDHLPDVGEVVPGALASSPALLGGGEGADPGSAIARSGAEADTPVARALGKRAVSPVGLVAAVEQVAAKATQLPPQRTEGALRSVEDQSRADKHGGPTSATATALANKGRRGEAVAAPLESKATCGELGSEASRAAEASRVEAQRLKEKAEAFRVEARHWELKAKESEAEVTRAAEASSAVQTVLETEIREHEALKSAARAACEALVVEGVQSDWGTIVPFVVVDAVVHVVGLPPGSSTVSVALLLLLESVSELLQKESILLDLGLKLTELLQVRASKLSEGKVLVPCCRWDDM
ncbi:uncharacterized protein [Miscanthus floridulus]|uniref:uncharacterized protein n=1 Tax=Miscanthus floridulus TaxID=154761 RepID=UPI0034589DB0